jgi:membrane protease YdiL (CAAX protease family)
MSILRRHTLAVFFLLAFLLSWWTWPFVALNPNSAPLLHFGVLFAAFITAGIAGGRSAIRDLIAAIIRWRVKPRWYVFALGVPVAAIVATAGVALGMGATLESLPRLAEGLLLLPVALVTTTLFAGPLSEEPGWRGIALPRMARHLGSLGASLVLGGIWAAWHLPLLVSDPSNQREPIPFALAVISASVVLTWVYASSGRSLFLAILFHGMFNSMAAAVLPAFAAADRVTLWWAFASVWVVIGIAFAVRLRGVRLEHPEPSQHPAGVAATV